MAETPLHRVRGWTPRHIDRLAASWIDSADQVVAISATSGGLQSLAAQMEVPEDEARSLVGLARAALAPEVLAGLESAFVSDERGMGALRPEEKMEDDDPPADIPPGKR